MKSISLKGKNIGNDSPCYIIAEIGFLFQDFEPKNGHPGAKQLIDGAIKAGADAVKIQTFQGRTWLSPKYTFNLDNTGFVNGRKLVQPYEIGKTTHKQIFDYCRGQDIAVFSTPSHPKDVDLLEKYDPDAHKIGSDDLTNLPLLAYIAHTQRPIILSTGMSTMDEVKKAVDTILPINSRLILLHCVSDYPVEPARANLRAITTLSKEFGLPIGWSDHTIGGNATALTAVALGACVVEKHFNTDPHNASPDAIHSATYKQFQSLIKDVKTNNLPNLNDPIIQAILGHGLKIPTEKTPNASRNNRKSVTAMRNFQKGELIKFENPYRYPHNYLEEKNFGIARPGNGLAPEWLLSGRRIRIKAPLIPWQTVTTKEVEFLD